MLGVLYPSAIAVALILLSRCHPPDDEDVRLCVAAGWRTTPARPAEETLAGEYRRGGQRHSRLHDYLQFISLLDVRQLPSLVEQRLLRPIESEETSNFVGAGGTSSTLTRCALG